MKKSFLTAILSITFVFLLGTLAHAQTVPVSGNLGAVTRGGTTRGTVVLTIPGNLHVNSSRPNSEFAIPTSVRLTATGGKVSGAVYPRGKNKKFSFSEDTLNVYEGRTTINFSVTVPKNYRGNTVNVKALVRYQACSNEVCYAPKTQTVNLTARVK
ncbi:MAG: protein-disulfide reductase DsbD domain-containing protein [Pyrinomonadaceae bacterium]